MVFGFFVVGVGTFFRAKCEKKFWLLLTQKPAPGGSQSIVFTSQPLPEVPSDGKDHEPSVRLLQYKVLGAIRALLDTPAKNITSIRKALNKSTKLSTKAMTMRETLGLSYHSDEIDRMNEYEFLDAFLMKCQEGLNLEVMLEAQ